MAIEVDEKGARGQQSGGGEAVVGLVGEAGGSGESTGETDVGLDPTQVDGKTKHIPQISGLLDTSDLSGIDRSDEGAQNDDDVADDDDDDNNNDGLDDVVSVTGLKEIGGPSTVEFETQINNSAGRGDKKNAENGDYAREPSNARGDDDSSTPVGGPVLRDASTTLLSLSPTSSPRPYGASSNSTNESNPEVSEVESVLPAFANSESRALFAKLQQLEQRVREAKEASGDEARRLSELEAHSKTVTKERAQWELLVEDVVTNEGPREDAYVKLMRRELDSVSTECKGLAAQRRQLKQQAASLRRDITLAEAKQAEFMVQQKLTRKEMDEWVRVAKRREDEKQELESYCMANDQLVKDLSTQLDAQRVLLARYEAQDERHRSVEDSLRLEMKGVVQDFDTERRLRRELRDEWQAVLSTLANQAKSIKTTNAEADTLRETLTARQQQYDAAEEDLRIMDSKVRAIEGAVAAKERTLQRAREGLIEIEAKQLATSDELGVEKARGAALVRELEEEHSKASALEEHIGRLKRQVDAKRSELKETQARIVSQREGTVSVEEDAARARDAIEERRKRFARIESEITTMLHECKLADAALARVREAKVSCSGRIAVSKSVAQKAEAERKTLLATIADRRATLDGIWQKLRVIKTKVAAAEGMDDGGEERRLIEAEIASKEAALGKANTTLQRAVKELRGLEHKQREANAQVLKLVDEEKRLASRALEKEVAARNLARTIRDGVLVIENGLVERDTAKLEAEKNAHALSKVATEATDLRRQIDDAESAHRAAVAEANLAWDKAKTKLKEGQSTQHGLKMESAELRDTLSKLQKRREAQRPALPRVLYGKGADGDECGIGGGGDEIDGEDDDPQACLARFVASMSQAREEVATDLEEARTEISVVETELEVLSEQSSEVQRCKRRASASPAWSNAISSNSHALPGGVVRAGAGEDGNNEYAEKCARAQKVLKATREKLCEVKQAEDEARRGVEALRLRERALEVQVSDTTTESRRMAAVVERVERDATGHSTRMLRAERSVYSHHALVAAAVPKDVRVVAVRATRLRGLLNHGKRLVESLARKSGCSEETIEEMRRNGIVPSAAPSPALRSRTSTASSSLSSASTASSSSSSSSSLTSISSSSRLGYSPSSAALSTASCRTPLQASLHPCPSPSSPC